MCTAYSSGQLEADFVYVVPRRKKDPIAFLSKKERQVLPRSGTTRFESEFIQQELPNLTPNMYDIPSAFTMSRHRISSTVGMGGKALRFTWRPSMAPSPATYDVPTFPGPMKLNKVPFNMCADRMPTVNKSITPGPGSYNILTVERDRRIPFRYSFTGKKSMIPAVEVKCCAVNLDTCSVCEESPKGDYWHMNHTDFLCRLCKDLQTPKDVMLYQKIRDCSFLHSHEETTAKVRLMEDKEVLKFQQKEAYLSKYFK